jgi:flagellar motor switch protein FliG
VSNGRNEGRTEAAGEPAAVAGASRAPSSARKAAIALFSLQEDVAIAVLSRLGPEEIRRLRHEMLVLGDVSDDQVTQILDELAASVASPLAMARAAGPAYLMRLAQRAFGEARAEQLLAAPLPPEPEPEPMDRLRGARVDDLAQLLVDEHPQVAAMVLTQLAPELAAKVLAAMSPELAAELVARLAAVQEVPAHAVAEAAQVLVRVLEAAGALAGADGGAAFDGLSFSAAVVRELGAPHGSAMLEQLAKRDRPAATRVRTAMLALEDRGSGATALTAQRGAS